MRTDSIYYNRKKGQTAVRLAAVAAVESFGASAPLRSKRARHGGELIQTLESRTLFAAATPTFDFSSSFPPADVQLNGGAAIVSNDLQLTSTAGTEQSRSAYYDTKVSVNEFVTRFVYTPTSIGAARAGGMTFVIQNEALTAVGSSSTSGGTYGYDGIEPSVALRIKYDGEIALLTDTTAAAQDNVKNETLKPEMNDFIDGHAYEFVLSYKDSTNQLTVSVTDRQTKDAFQLHYTVDIPALVGASTAWVGFTGSTGDSASEHAVQTINEWAYYGTSGELPPVADFTANHLSPYQALAGNIMRVRTGSQVAFDGGYSADVDGTLSTHEWDFNYDGTFNASTTGQTVNHTFSTAGTYVVALRVVDNASNDSVVVQTMNVKVDDALAAVIAPSRTSGAGPLTVHFDASETLGLAGGDLVNSRFQWEFDRTNADSTGQYESGEGMVAAHVFEKPGTYTVRLSVTDAAGNTDTEETTITVTSAEAWTTYYFSESGDDGAVGDIDHPKKTIDHAISLANGATSGSPRRILFKKGDTWSLTSRKSLTGTGVIFGSYEDPADPSTAEPILEATYSGTGSGALSPLLDVSGSDIRVMGLEIRSQGTDVEGVGADPGGIELRGSNNLVYRAKFRDLGNQGVFLKGSNNTVFGSNVRNVAPYFVFGSDPRNAAVIGNDVETVRGANHDAEHVVRFQSGYKGYIAHNKLKANDTKSNVQIRGQAGLMVVYDNHILGRDNSINPQNDDSEEYQHHILWEGNRIEYDPTNVANSFGGGGSALRIEGARHVAVRNNVTVNYQRFVDIERAVWGGEVRDVSVYNNSVFEDSSRSGINSILARIHNSGQPGKDIALRNNLMHSTRSTAPASGFAAVHVDSGMGSVLTSSNNLIYGTNWNVNSNIYKIGTSAPVTPATWQATYGVDVLTAPQLISSDPANADFLKPSPTSPALDAGASVPVYIDHDGTVRPQGPGIDIGAFEGTSGNPAQPAGLTATPSTGGIQLDWADNTEVDLAGYDVYRSSSSTGPWTKLNTLGLLTTSSYNDTTASTGVVSYYEVKAVDTGALESAPATVNATRPSSGQAAYPSGTPWAVGATPITIQAEDYDTGGQGVAFNDTTPTNVGGQYRTGAGEAVDVKLISGQTNQYRISDAKAGEWLEYTIDVATAGNYVIDFRVGNGSTSADFHAEIDGVDVTGALTSPGTGSYDTFQTVSSGNVALTVGQHVLRFTFDTNSTNTFAPSLDWIKVTQASTPSAPSSLVATGTSSTAVGLTWLDNASNETGFTIERSSSSTFSSIDATYTESANVTSRSITGLTAGATYYFRVKATNGAGSSAWSNTTTAVMISAGGKVTLVGTTGNDTTTASTGGGVLTIVHAGTTLKYTSSIVTGIDLAADLGNDSIDFSALSIPTTISGGNGNDTILGGSGADSIGGGAHVDSIVGNDGNDTIGGNDGNDTVNGGNGADYIAGGNHDDSIVGGLGADTLEGNGGTADLVSYATHATAVSVTLDASANDGSAGENDFVNADFEIVDGSDLADTLNASSVATSVTLRGAAGNDTITGGTAADYFEGGSGNDIVNGGDGDDVIVGNNGADQLFGNDGNDVFFSADAFSDTVTGGVGTDHAGVAGDTLGSSDGLDVLVSL